MTKSLGESKWVRIAAIGLLDLPPEILQDIAALVLDNLDFFPKKRMFTFLQSAFLNKFQNIDEKILSTTGKACRASPKKAPHYWPSRYHALGVGFTGNGMAI